MSISYVATEDSLEKINDFFTKNYAFKHWFFKLKIYSLILDDSKKFLDSFGDEELKKENVESMETSIKSEIFFTFFHMAECLFSLMYYCSSSKVPWLAMKSMRFDKLCDYVRDITNGKIDDSTLRHLFYHGVVGDEAKKPEVLDSIKFIKEFLSRMGKVFLDNKIYREYKHGLRAMPSKSYFKIIAEDIKLSNPSIERMGDVHAFLETNLIKKDGRAEVHSLSLKTVSFDYKLYTNLCIYIFRLMSNLFGIRRQEEKLKPGDKMLVTLFNEDSIKEVFKEDLERKFSFSINYPYQK